MEGFPWRRCSGSAELAWHRFPITGLLPNTVPFPNNEVDSDGALQSCFLVAGLDGRLLFRSGFIVYPCDPIQLTRKAAVLPREGTCSVVADVPYAGDRAVLVYELPVFGLFMSCFETAFSETPNTLNHAVINTCTS
jgi:hypothetical protein